jgi:hypothetical protein
VTFVKPQTRWRWSFRIAEIEPLLRAGCSYEIRTTPPSADVADRILDLA